MTNLMENHPYRPVILLQTRQRPKAIRLSTGILAGLFLISAGHGKADVVIVNTPNGTTGGSLLIDGTGLISSRKSLIFTTGRIPSQINTLTLGLNPFSVTTPLPLTTSLGVSIWSTTSSGANPVPLSALTASARLTATIGALRQLYTFDSSSLGSLSSFTLNPDTTYGLTLSGLVDVAINDQPKWGNTGNTGAGGTEPTGLNGFTYNSFAISDDGGLTWCTAQPAANPCGFPYNAILLDVRFLGVTPGTTTPASAPFSPLLAGGTVIVDQPGTFPTDYILSSLGGTIDINGKVSTFTGTFSGNGPLTFSNSASGGQTSLVGLSTYTGATTVQQGAAVFVNGSIAPSSGLLVQSGGLIGGSGQLPGTTIASGGVIAPGNSIGTLTVNGNYSLNGGTQAIEIQGPQSDSIVVTGTVTSFSGTTALSSFGGGTAWPGFRYTLLTASDPFSTPLALGLDAASIAPSALLQFGTALIQEADGNPRTFDVQWRPRNGSGAVASALQALGATGGNGTAAAGVFDSAFNRLAIAAASNANATGAAIGSTGFTTGQAMAAGLSSDLVFRLANLLAIPSGAALEQAVNSITPESYAAFQSVGLNVLRQQRQTLMAQAGGCRTTGWEIGGTTGKSDASPADRKSGTPVCVFATGGNATATMDSRDGLSGYDAAVAGGFYGIEVQPSQRWTLGAAYGYGTAGLSNLGAGSNSISSNVNSGSLYGVYTSDGSWTIKGLLGYGNYNVSGLRRLIAVGNGNPITGSTTAHGYTAGLQADYAIPLSKPTAKVPITLKPQLGVAYGAYQQDGFSESGDPTMNLNVGGNTSHSLVGTLGAELMAAIPLNPETSQLLKPRFAVAYQVDALADRNGNSSLNASLPGAGVSFSSAGQNRGINDLTLSGSLEYVVASKASLYVSASYEAFSTGRQFAYGGGVKLSF
jgi:uncharacterized protein with beta-barrel porin domain